MRAVQHFSDEYLEYCRSLKPEQVAKFLEDFRLLHGAPGVQRSRLISLRVPEALLGAFKTKAALSGLPYQTQIKKLMQAWVGNDV